MKSNGAHVPRLLAPFAMFGFPMYSISNDTSNDEYLYVWHIVFYIPQAALLLSLSPFNPTHKEPGQEYAYIFLMAVLGRQQDKCWQ